MAAALILLAGWIAVLAYIAAVKPETMQMTWLVLVLLILASPLIAVFWPAFR